MPLRALVVDDAGPARSELRHLLGAHDVEVVSEAADARGALAAAASGELEAIFLDVEMPGITGIELARALAGHRHAPAVVFVTAHAGYAVEAFAVEAFDYLLKPVDPERLARVVRRLEQRTGGGDARTAGPPARIPVVAGGRTELVDPDEMYYAEADGDYSRIHTFDRVYLSTASLRELEQVLPADRFVRTHRSYLVNLARVAAVRRAGGDRLRLVLDDEARTELDVARRQTRHVRELLRV
jgi:DNA-binding LytR/AlgR family response regulator